MYLPGDRSAEQDQSGNKSNAAKEQDLLIEERTAQLPRRKESKQNYEYLLNTNNTEPEQDNMLASLFANQEDNKIENGQATKSNYEKLKLCELSILILCVLCEVLSIFEYFLEFHGIYEEESIIILWAVMVTTGVIALLQFPRMHIKITFQKSRGLLPKTANIFKKKFVIKILAQIAFILPHPNPFLYDQKIYFFVPYENREVYTTVNEVLHLIMLSRILIGVRTFLIFTKWRTSRAQRVCDMYGTECNYLFVLRCLFQYNNYFAITITGVPSIIVFAFAILICEKPLVRVTEDITLNPSILTTYPDCLWNVVVTMATVGYGDFFPRTLQGRFISFILCLWGVLIVSLTVVTLSNILNISDLESKAIFLLEKLKVKKDLQSKSGFVLTRFTRLVRSFKEKKKLSSEFNDIKKDLRDVKLIKRHYRSMNMEGNISNKIDNYFEILGDSMKDVEGTQKVLLDGYIEIMNHLNLDNSKLVQHREKLNKRKPGRTKSENFDNSMVSEEKKTLYLENVSLNKRVK